MVEGGRQGRPLEGVKGHPFHEDLLADLAAGGTISFDGFENPPDVAKRLAYIEELNLQRFDPNMRDNMKMNMKGNCKC